MPWLREQVELRHYLHTWPHWQSRPLAYTVKLDALPVGLVVVGGPHAVECTKWWGKPGLRTKWQVVDLSRIWLEPTVQQGGRWCSPEYLPGFTDRKGKFRPTTLTSFVIPQLLQRVQVDWVARNPPVYLEQPYHITLAISYHDPEFHKGTIYQKSGAVPMYEQDGKPAMSSKRKYGWCWELPEPTWAWRDIEIVRPRTLRLF